MQTREVTEVLNIKPHTMASEADQKRAAEVGKLIKDGCGPNKIELGQLRRKFITREHPTVKTCGHKVCLTSPPKSSCNDCWHAYFLFNKELVRASLDVFTGFGEKEGRLVIERKNGRKWLKAFERFVVGLAAEAAVAAASQPETTQEAA